MRQLSSAEARQLYDGPSPSDSNVTLIHIYDPATAAGSAVRFKQILAHIEGRLERAPVFRQKLLRVPFDLDHPYWVDDEKFDLEHHVRHIALPRPGDWRQFSILASRIHARALDMDRPLWEIHVVEGLDGLSGVPPGSFALLTKIHGSALDPTHGDALTRALHDTEPDGPADAPPRPWFPQAPDGTAKLLARAYVHNLLAPWRPAAPWGRVVDRWWRGAQALARHRAHGHAPVMRFNAIVSPRRVFETRRFALDALREVRGLVEGATVHDVVLAICGGGLRRYLAHLDELPGADLSAMAPILRKDRFDDRAERDSVGWMHVSLGTSIEEPVARLAHIRERTVSSAMRARALGARELTDIGRHSPAGTLALTGKLLQHTTALQGRHAPLASCSIVNVPGPSVPLYLGGARLSYFSSLMPISDGMGLAFSATSYDGHVAISVTSCREQLPDPALFAQCLCDSFQDYRDAARRAAGPVRRRPRTATTA